MGEQLLQWQGQFGVDYTDRNVVDWRTRLEGFARMLDGYDIGNVLEVGCNRGHNLIALRQLGYQAAGIEPGEYALGIARHEHSLGVLQGTIYEIPDADETFDLVFTCGVLIHVPPERLDEALAEVVRVSRRYVLAIEYAAVQDTEVEYRGQAAMMWNRDYGAHYRRHGLTLLNTGILGSEFDRAWFWLLEKSS